MNYVRCDIGLLWDYDQMFSQATFVKWLGFRKKLLLTCPTALAQTRIN